MIFYGLAEYRLDEIVEFYASYEQAEEAVRQVLQDEPEWVGVIGVEGVDLGSRDGRSAAELARADRSCPTTSTT